MPKPKPGEHGGCGGGGGDGRLEQLRGLNAFEELARQGGSFRFTTSASKARGFAVIILTVSGEHASGMSVSYAERSVSSAANREPMNLRSFFITDVIVVLFVLSSAAQMCAAQRIKFTPFKPSGLYDVGEKAGWTVMGSAGKVIRFGRMR